MIKLIEGRRQIVLLVARLRLSSYVVVIFIMWFVICGCGCTWLWLDIVLVFLYVCVCVCVLFVCPCYFIVIGNGAVWLSAEFSLDRLNLLLHSIDLNGGTKITCCCLYFPLQLTWMQSRYLFITVFVCSWCKKYSYNISMFSLAVLTCVGNCFWPASLP